MTNSTALKDLPGIQQFRMDNQVAIVTGGSKGLGAAIAAGLASCGSAVVVVSRNLQEAQATAAEIADGFQVTATGLQADVSSPDQVQQMTAQVMDSLGRIDVLINSAGINIRGSIEDLSYEDFQQVQRINVDGTWLCCKAVTPHMKAAGYGRIVNLASTLGLVGLANRTPYTSSKGAVVQMTRALGLELATSGIAVNAICPGPFLTPMNVPIADTEEARKFIIGAVAQERWGELSEIQGAAILLSSPAAAFMNGSLVTVDGGWTAR